MSHSFGVDRWHLPYGFTGLIAQGFDFLENIELFGVRKLFPSMKMTFSPRSILSPIALEE